MTSKAKLERIGQLVDLLEPFLLSARDSVAMVGFDLTGDAYISPRLGRWEIGIVLELEPVPPKRGPHGHEPIPVWQRRWLSGNWQAVRTPTEAMQVANNRLEEWLKELRTTNEQ